MNQRGTNKSRFNQISTEKLLATSGIGKHVRHGSQANISNMRNIGRILSPSRSNNRSTSMKRKNSIIKGIKYSKSKATKLQMNYISALPDSKEASLKNKRFNSTNKLTEKDSFPNIRSKIKAKGFQSYLNTSANIPNQVIKVNSRKSRLMNKSQDFMIKTTKSKDGPGSLSVSYF